MYYGRNSCVFVSIPLPLKVAVAVLTVLVPFMLQLNVTVAFLPYIIMLSSVAVGVADPIWIFTEEENSATYKLAILIELPLSR